MPLNSFTRGQTATATGGVAAAVIAMATAFLQPWEGKRNTTYLDTIANPPVLTVCYGETDPQYAYRGASYTDQECLDMLKSSVAAFYADMERVANTDAIPVSVQASLLELLYNVGMGQFSTSTILRLANEGDYAAACAQLDRWVNAGGRRIQGLVNRRNASEEMCIRDI